MGGDAMPELFTIHSGAAPLIINVPHAGIVLPPALETRLTEAGRAMPDTDWHVDKLYKFVSALDVTLMCATHSRIVVDLNRDPAGTVLYAGASNTEICPTSTFADAPIYVAGQQPLADEIEARLDQYWRPYHQRLQGEVNRIKARYGYCILIDAHSIASRVPRFFSGKLPDLNLGTADGRSCDSSLAAQTFSLMQSTQEFTAVQNGRFKGGYITRHYGRPEESVHALQLELAQSCYMDESRPHEFNVQQAAPLVRLLREWIEYLCRWTPDQGTLFQKK